MYYHEGCVPNCTQRTCRPKCGIWNCFNCFDYSLQAAQEKEELQREGDKLDASIRKAEKEIRALENTVRMLINRNESFRRKLNPVGESSMFTFNDCLMT